MPPVATLALAGLATYALRLTPIAVLGRRAAPPRVERALRYATPAILAGLVATAAAHGGGLVALVVPSPRTVALLLGAFVAWRTRNLVATVALALATFWALTAVWA